MQIEIAGDFFIMKQVPALLAGGAGGLPICPRSDFWEGRLLVVSGVIREAEAAPCDF
jgi:hypothetical protein